MSVLFVMVRSAEAPEVYGGERSTLMTALGLREIGLSPRFLVTAEDELARELRQVGLPVDVVPVDNPFAGIRSGRGLLGRLARLARLAAAVAQVTRRHGLRIVHAAGVPATLGSLAGARLAGAGLVYHIRGLSLAARTRWYEELTILLADRTIAVADSLRDHMVDTAHPPLRGALARRIATVYNGFPLERLRDRMARDEARRRLGIAADAYLCLQVASIDVLKQQRLVIERTLPRLVAAVPEAVVAFIGGTKDADYLAGCHEAVARLGLKGSVRFPGYLAPEQVFEWYAAADVLLIASQTEGLPRVSVEAQASGIPVVTVRIPGPMEVVRDGETGISVAPDDFPALADGLIALARDPERRARLGAAAARSDWGRFSPERHRTALLAAYGDLLG